jgi:hypothetical protein
MITWPANQDTYYSLHVLPHKKKTNESRIDAHSKKEMTSREIFLSSGGLTKPGQVFASEGAATLEAKKKRTEEDSVSCMSDEVFD